MPVNLQTPGMILQQQQQQQQQQQAAPTNTSKMNGYTSKQQNQGKNAEW